MLALAFLFFAVITYVLSDPISFKFHHQPPRLITKKELDEVLGGSDNLDAVPYDFDCPMRTLALDFAQMIQPWLSQDQLQEIADALNGSPEKASGCNVKPPSTLIKHRKPPIWKELEHKDLNIFSVYVSPNDGNDKYNDGSINKPFNSIEKALEYTRQHSNLNQKKRIILREGRHYLKDTLYFNENDSNLMITNMNGEQAEISGAVNLKCTWTQYKGDIYKCNVPKSINITNIPGLRVNGSRAIRARYPNANPETDGFGSTLKAASWIPPVSTNPKPDFDINPDEPLRNDTAAGWFQKYNLGMGGVCENQFTPPAGYWCSSNPQGGGAFTYRIPTGLIYSKTILPNAPYADPSQGVVQAWRPGHWSSWMFTVDGSKYDPNKEIIMFSKGGFQGARGNNNGDEFYVENIFEELDAPGEYFFNVSTRELYYYNNETGKNPSNLQFEATKLKVFMNYTGSMSKPVKGVKIQGTTLRDSAYTYMDPHGMPSGGDWGLQRTGVIYLDGVDGAYIQSNMMTRLDGNAISINRYARNVVIYKNEIIWNGDSAVTSWGDTEGVSFPESGDKTSMGWDGTNGNQPRGVNMSYNLVHELGIWEKQSSLWFQAKSCQNILVGNIFYNGPRAGINFNDGFGGKSLLLKNLLFNTCRESGDHGPFNSWDRQVYVTAVGNGTASTEKGFDEIKQNFFIANYNSINGVDNDDGSAYYDTHDNFFVYSHDGLKNDFGGHDNRHYNNVDAYTNKNCFDISAQGGQLADHIDWYYNNTCVINNPDVTAYGSFSCDTTALNTWPKLGYNQIYLVNTSNTPHVGLCGKTESQFQSMYNTDANTKINGLVNDTELIAYARELLWK